VLGAIGVIRTTELYFVRSAQRKRAC